MCASNTTIVAIRLDNAAFRQAVILGGLEDMFYQTANEVDSNEENPSLPLMKLFAERGILNAITIAFDHRFPDRYPECLGMASPSDNTKIREDLLLSWKGESDE